MDRPSFKLYLIQEFERLKYNETYQKENIVPTLTDKQKLFVYSNEADVINVALFGITAKEWREKNPNKEGNIRDYTDFYI